MSRNSVFHGVGDKAVSRARGLGGLNPQKFCLTRKNITKIDVNKIFNAFFEVFVYPPPKKCGVKHPPKKNTRYGPGA